VEGTSDNYTIAYDKEAVKEKITEDWQKEKQEFKDLLKGRKPEEDKAPPVQKEPEEKDEEKEEYFDF
jgi:Ni,Fe-hydrogenase I large subunit